MSTTTTPSGLNLDALNAMFTIPEASEDSVRGRTVVMYSTAVVSNCIAATIAFSACSSFWMGFITYTLLALLIGLIASALLLWANVSVSDDKFEAIGRAAGSAYNTVTGWFTKTPASV